jgi:hypothetical protein
VKRLGALPGRKGPKLTSAERESLERVARLPFGAVRNATAEGIAPLLEPVRRALDGCGYGSPTERFGVQRAILRGALHLGKVPQGWTPADWIEVRRLFGKKEKIAFTVCAILGYGVVATRENGFFQMPQRLSLARRLLGRPVVDGEYERVRDVLARIGFHVENREGQVRTCVADLLLQHGSSSLNAVTDESLAAHAALVRSRGPRKALFMVSFGLAELGITRVPLSHYVPPRSGFFRPAREGVPREWVDWCERWRDAATSSAPTRERHFLALLMVGRWLARDHPSVTSPADWTSDLALAYVRHIEQVCIGDISLLPRHEARAGEPMSPNTKKGMLSAIRVFFHQLQDWGWIERRFSPSRGFPTPRQVTRAAQYNPRPIDDAHWLKLRAAALTLQREDLPLLDGMRRSYQYPLELARAVAATWVFSGCRANEIERLEVGCTYVEHVSAQTDPATGEVLPAFDQHMLRVPVSKTCGEFVKPIEEPMARAIADWERVRPRQRRLLDKTTGQLTDPLFCYRGQRIGRGFVNRVLIPVLLRKAGLPPEDTHGAITSHRARATMATKLYNPASGLTPLEVMHWLGHRRLASGQHYIALTPTQLMTAFHKSSKLTENLRMVGALVDSRPEAGQPVLRYDLGHGWCTNPVYAMCAHRMACARCSFYEPAAAFADTLSRQKNRYVRMLQLLDLTEDERAAVAGDADAADRLISRLAGQPTPDEDIDASFRPEPPAKADSAASQENDPGPGGHQVASPGSVIGVPACTARRS